MDMLGSAPRKKSAPQTLDPERKIHVLVVSRYPLIRRALRVLLERDGSFFVDDEAASPQDAARKLADLRPDVALVDACERGDQDLEVLVETQKVASPVTRVVVVTTDSSPQSCLRALRMGAAGYLLASADPEYACRALKTAAGGETIVSGALTQALTARLVSPQPLERSPDTLTAREIEVIRWAGQGLSAKQIAMRLSMAESTVKIHLRAVYQKLGLRNRAQAVACVAASGLLDRQPQP